jgi:hypothetical protein
MRPQVDRMLYVSTTDGKPLWDASRGWHLIEDGMGMNKYRVQKQVDWLHLRADHNYQSRKLSQLSITEALPKRKHIPATSLPTTATDNAHSDTNNGNNFVHPPQTYQPVHTRNPPHPLQPCCTRFPPPRHTPNTLPPPTRLLPHPPPNRLRFRYTSTTPSQMGHTPHHPRNYHLHFPKIQ